MLVVCTTIIILTVWKKLQNQNTVLINEQYEVAELNNYRYHSIKDNVHDDELKKTVREVQVKEIYDDIEKLSIEDLNV